MNTRYPTAILITSAAALLTGCARPVVGYYRTHAEIDIPFVERDGTPIRLNVIRPVGVTKPRPLVLWIHGGGWAGGNRCNLQSLATTCSSFGYVAATTDYRLTKDGHRFPAALHDVASALRFLCDNAERFNIDATRIIVAGDSAGGHLALMLGLCRDARLLGLGDSEGSLPPVSGIVNIYGPTDMPALAAIRPYNPMTRPLLDAFMGDPPEKSPQRWRDASPITFVHKDGPPILTIHGRRDSIVPFSQAETLAERCKSIGQPHRLIALPDADHGWTLLPTGPTMTSVMPAMLHFIAECVIRERDVRR